MQDLKCNLDNAKKMIVACPALHNLCVKWADGFDFEDAVPELAQPPQRPILYNEE